MYGVIKVIVTLSLSLHWTAIFTLNILVTKHCPSRHFPVSLLCCLLSSDEMVMVATTVNTVYLSPAKICYLKFALGSNGRTRAVPLFGPLNPSNLQIGSGYFEKVGKYLRIENYLLSSNLFVQGPSDKLNMALKALTDDEKTELKEQFCVLDKEESGFIQLNELKDALDLAGFKVPGWRVRDMIDKIDRETTNCPGAVVGQRKLSYGEFEHVSIYFVCPPNWSDIQDLTTPAFLCFKDTAKCKKGFGCLSPIWHKRAGVSITSISELALCVLTFNVTE